MLCLRSVLSINHGSGETRRATILWLSAVRNPQSKLEKEALVLNLATEGHKSDAIDETRVLLIGRTMLSAFPRKRATDISAIWFT